VGLEERLYARSAKTAESYSCRANCGGRGRLNEQREYSRASVRELAKFTLFRRWVPPVAETLLRVEGETRKRWIWDGRRRRREGLIRMTMDRHKKLDRWSGHAVPIASGQTRGDQVGPGQEQETDEFIYTIVSKQERQKLGPPRFRKTLRSGAPNLAPPCWFRWRNPIRVLFQFQYRQ